MRSYVASDKGGANFEEKRRREEDPYTHLQHKVQNFAREGLQGRLDCCLRRLHLLAGGCWRLHLGERAPQMSGPVRFAPERELRSFECLTLV